MEVRVRESEMTVVSTRSYQSAKKKKVLELMIETPFWILKKHGIVCFKWLNFTAYELWRTIQLRTKQSLPTSRKQETRKEKWTKATCVMGRTLSIKTWVTGFHPFSLTAKPKGWGLLFSFGSHDSFLLTPRSRLYISFSAGSMTPHRWKLPLSGLLCWLKKKLKCQMKCLQEIPSHRSVKHLSLNFRKCTG